MIKKLLSLSLVFCLAFSAFGCVAKGDNYTYGKQSETMLHFNSSDEGLDNFLNDYLHRHLRYDDYRIGDMSLGTSVMFNKEWEALSLFFFDSTSNAVPDDRVEIMETYLNDVPVDKFGYTWQALEDLQPASGPPTTYFGQGWPFPDYAQSKGWAKGWEFNGSNVDGWTAEVNDLLDNKALKVANGLITANVDAASKLSFISPLASINAFHAPFIELDTRLIDRKASGKNANIEQINIYWKTNENDEWSTDKMVSKDFATLPIDITANYSKHIYFPMYLHDEWGMSTSTTIKQVKVEYVAGENKTFTGPQSISFLRANYDTRHSNNSTLLLAAAKKHFEFTGKVDNLTKNINRYRKTTQFLISHLGGESGLIDNEYFVGHNGSKQGLGTSIGNGYWDILSTPEVSLYTNIYFYKAIKSMAYLELKAEELKLEVEKPSIQDVDGTLIPYVQTSATLNTLLEKIKSKIQEPVDFDKKTGFFDTEKGRFIEGFDYQNKPVDYGFIMFNLEVLTEEIATDEQAAQVMSWINGDRIIESDLEAGDQRSASGKVGTAVQSDGSLSIEGTFGIYDLEFAPRSTTVKNYNHYVWAWGGTNPFGDQVQDGGAIMYVSYYDIMSRLDVNGADDAFNRLKEIQKWYDKVSVIAKREGVGTDLPSKEFYRVYYEELGMTMQGGQNGGIGLDMEFLESALLYASIPNGFFGLGSEKLNELSVAPSLPSGLDWWAMENLAYSGVVYDLTVGEKFVQIDSVRGNTSGLSVKVTLDKPEKKFSVKIDGVETTDYKIDGNKVVVTTSFKPCKITIG